MKKLNKRILNAKALLFIFLCTYLLLAYEFNLFFVGCEQVSESTAVNDTQDPADLVIEKVIRESTYFEEKSTTHKVVIVLFIPTLVFLNYLLWITR